MVKKKGTHLLNTSNFETVVGKGVIGMVNGKKISLGNHKLMQQREAIISPGPYKKVSEEQKLGKTVSFLAIEDVAIESAEITLVKGDLEGIVTARKLIKKVMQNIKDNLFFALVYNSLGIPIAAGILYPFWGILLSPMIAAAAMSFSSVSVIANSLRLRGAKIT